MAGVIQVNGTRGELSPLLHSRIDLDHYQAGWHTARNWISMRFGGMTRMPGTRFYGAISNGTTKRGRLLPFKFNRSQTYAIEATEFRFRFWTAFGRVESPPGTPVNVVTPYAEADLDFIQYRQIGDVMYLICRGYPPKTLTRLSETNWVLEDYKTEDGPFLPINRTGTTLTPNNYGAFVPKMSSDTAPSGTVSSSGPATDTWKVFDKNSSTSAQFDDTGANKITYRLAGGATKIPNAYWLQAPENAASSINMPSQWVVQGSNDGVSWATLDTQTGSTGWTASERRYFEFANDVAYEYIRLDYSGGSSGDPLSNEVFMAEFAPNESGDSMSTVTVTASSTVGINDGAGFQASDVGRILRLRGSDGRWRWARIVSRTNTNVIGVVLYGQALPDLAPIASWRMSVYGVVPGYPTAIGIHEDRIGLAGAPETPNSIDFTVSADYDNFHVSTPVVDDDAINVRLSGGELNTIQWLADGTDLLVGTEGSLRALGRNEGGRAFAPGNVRQRNETEVTASHVPPIKIENMLIMIDLYRTRMYEVGYTQEIDGYLARELSALQEHLVGKGISAYAYQASPHRILWCVTDEGTLLAATYDRDQKVFGITECELGPNSFAESVVSLPAIDKDGDEVWLIVRRNINGSDNRYIEKLSSFYREGYSEQAYPIYAHSAGVYQGAATASVTGITYLPNEVVGVWADGRDLGDVTVSAAGVLTLPEGFTAETIVWGKRYSSRLQTLRLASIGNGPQIGQRVNLVKALLDFYQSTRMRAGTPSGLYDVVTEADQQLNPYDPPVLRDGSIEVTLDDSWENNGVLIVETNSMFPATVRSLTMFPEGEP